jgi:hypothetical protein
MAVQPEHLGELQRSVGESIKIVALNRAGRSMNSEYVDSPHVRRVPVFEPSFRALHRPGVPHSLLCPCMFGYVLTSGSSRDGSAPSAPFSVLVKGQRIRKVNKRVSLLVLSAQVTFYHPIFRKAQPLLNPSS